MTEQQRLKFLKYVRRKKSITRAEIKAYFYKHSISDALWTFSFDEGHVIPAGHLAHDMKNGGQFVSLDDDYFKLSDSGFDYIASNKLFTREFFIEKMLCPIIVSVISSIITSIITAIITVRLIV